MRPFFSLNAGEYLATAHIERHFKWADVWLPSRDTGVDLLVSGRRNGRTVGLQVKYSKDFLVTSRPGRFGPEHQKKLRASGWWTVDRDKLRDSRADYWIFVLQGFAGDLTVPQATGSGSASVGPEHPGLATPPGTQKAFGAMPYEHRAD